MVFIIRGKEAQDARKDKAQQYRQLDEALI
jgi:hypothetical protein